MKYKAKELELSVLKEPLATYISTYHPIMRIVPKNFQSLLDDKMALISTISTGVSYDLYAAIAALLPFNEAEWAELLGISAKSLQRYKTDSTHVFKPLQSEKILEVAEVLLLGHEVLESSTNFNKWLKSPSLALAGMSPYQLLSSSYGKELVMDELHRIEHAVFA